MTYDLHAAAETAARAECRVLALTDLDHELGAVAARLLNAEPTSEAARTALRASMDLRHLRSFESLRSRGWGLSLLADIETSERLLS